MRSIALLSLCVLAPAIAHAEDEPPAAPPAAADATTPAGERVTMPAKRGMIRALMDINLSTDAVGKPVSISPDLWYGVNDKLTIGLVHSDVGTTGVIGIPGSSLCLGDACTDVYNGFGLDVRYTLTADKKKAIAFEGALIANELDPFELALKLGVVGRLRVASKVAVDFQPSIFFGLTNRDGVAMTAGNKEVLVLPATLVYSLNPKLGLLAQLDLILPFSNASDFYLFGFSLGASYAVTKQVSLEGAFSLPALAGGGALTGFDFRSFTLGGAYAF